jgi:hypothetical protein
MHGVTGTGKVRAPTQRQRIEALLVDRGLRGVASFELYQLGMPRGAAVVDRLRKSGWAVETHRERHRSGSQGVRYVLRSRPAPASRVTSHGDDSKPEALLDVPRARSGHYEDVVA